MAKPNENIPSFNLWTEPWIALERDGILTQHSIREALLNAHNYFAIYDPSPLVVVGIHRLLTAILQDALNPQENHDLEQLWKDGKFPAENNTLIGLTCSRKTSRFFKALTCRCSLRPRMNKKRKPLLRVCFRKRRLERSLPTTVTERKMSESFRPQQWQRVWCQFRLSLLQAVQV